MLAEFPEFLDVVLVRAASFDEADIDRPIERLLVIEWRDVEIDEVDQFEEPLVNVEQRHVAAEAAGQSASRERGFVIFVTDATVMSCVSSFSLDVATDWRFVETATAIRNR